ncbi:hypothetical protein IFO70_05910 [Phormidium tenue FACHB-886]|nr:hypothetical protein [Phormidium tenue FACHB-886]
MAKFNVEALLNQLAILRDRLNSDSELEAAVAEARQLLKSKQMLAVMHTAKWVGEQGLTQLIPDLVAAFDRFLIKPVETDPNCHAKGAIADALYRLNASAEAVFLQGIRHIQMEPVWGGRVDTAPPLRGICAMGLVRMNYPDALTELADLLADPEIPARIAAARAIAYSGNESGAPLLRLRSLAGDEAEVIAECLGALIKLTPHSALPFAARFLDAPSAQIQELTALAIGESRLSGAFGLLQPWWGRQTDPELRKSALLAIAMLRSDEAIQFLLSLVAKGRPLDAKDAIAALKLYQQDKLLWQRVEAAVEERGEPSLLSAAY